ncbi:MAG: hypothetical protein LBQ78_07715 [Tannerellaceae bacterium]|jgi:hypothetical protein|nr:hypothetical protein [Tannerellaceae bacterium]
MSTDANASKNVMSTERKLNIMSTERKLNVMSTERSEWRHLRSTRPPLRSEVSPLATLGRHDVLACVRIGRHDVQFALGRHDVLPLLLNSVNSLILKILILMMMTLLTGCASRREEVRRDSLAVVVRDSLVGERVWRGAVWRRMRVERVELSEPDSAGRQYATAVTVATAGEEGVAASLSAVREGSSASLDRESRSVVREEVRPVVPGFGLGWRVFLLLAVVGFCFLRYGRRRG